MTNTIQGLEAKNATLIKELKASRLREQDALAEARSVRAEMRKAIEQARAEGTEDLRELMEQERSTRADWHEAHLEAKTHDAPDYAEEIRLLEKLAATEEKIARLVPKDAQAQSGRRRAATERQEVTILRMRDEGLSLRAIAEKVGLGLQSVRTVIDESGRRRQQTAREHAKARARRYRERKADLKAHAAEEAAWARRQVARDAVGVAVFEAPLPKPPRAGQ